MGIRHIGYPCVRVGNDQQTVKTCQLKNATPERLKELISRNLDNLMSVLQYNAEHGITFFRIHSDTIPFASHPDVDFDWVEVASDRLSEISEFIENTDQRISMHPGQYTVLNSDDDGVVNNAVRNLRYHTRFLDSLGLGQNAKIIIHIGGVYGDRHVAMERFVEQVNDLDDTIRNRLVIENDETSYHVKQLLWIAEKTDLPVVFDWLHHELYAPDSKTTISAWLKECFQTWEEPDGQPITHFSSQSEGDRGHHADRINPDDFKQFKVESRELEPFDVMLECKDKEVALMELRDSLDQSPPDATAE